LEADGDVRLEADCALLHPGLGGAGVDEDLPQRLRVGQTLLDAAHVRLGDDLHQWDAGAVEVHERSTAHVQQAAGVLLDVNAPEPQNVFVTVASSRWVAKPMTSSYGLSLMGSRG